MNVKVRDGLAAVCAVIDHHAEAVFCKTEVGGDLRSGEKKVAKDRLISGLRFAEARDDFVGHNQHVHRCLRRNIAEDEAVLVTVYHIGGDFTVADFLENRLHSARNLASGGLSGKLEIIQWWPIPTHPPCVRGASWPSQVRADIRKTKVWSGQMEDHPAAWAADLRGFRDDPAARMATKSPWRTVGAGHRGTHASRLVSSGHGGDGRRDGTLGTPPRGLPGVGARAGGRSGR